MRRTSVYRTVSTKWRLLYRQRRNDPATLPPRAACTVRFTIVGIGSLFHSIIRRLGEPLDEGGGE